jgi:hypothetical protein
MKTIRKTSPTASFAAAMAVVASAWGISLMLPAFATAQPSGGQQRERPQGPPPEALAACKSLASGAECSFTGRRGAMTGTCVGPQGQELACRPKNAPGGAASAAKK